MLGPLVEIGTYFGKSTIYLAAAAVERGTVVVTVDHHRGSEEHQPGWGVPRSEPRRSRYRPDRYLPTMRRTLHVAGLEDHVEALVGRSNTFARLWSTPVALVFIDGGHTEEAARLDYECWAPHVVQGGYLVIHDVFEDPADGGLGPYQIYQTAIHSGLFVQDGCTGSLRTLRSAGVVIACEDGLVGADRQH